MRTLYALSLLLLIVTTTLQAGFQVTTPSPARKVSDVGTDIFKIIAHDSLSDDIQMNAANTAKGHFIAYAVKGDGIGLLPTDTYPPSLPPGMTVEQFDLNRFQSRLTIRFAEFSEAQNNDFSEVNIYPYTTANSDGTTDCLPCIAELDTYKCASINRLDWDATFVKIDMVANRNINNKEVAIAVTVFYDEEKAALKKYTIYTMKAKIVNSKWRIDPASVKILLRHLHGQPGGPGASALADVGITPHTNNIDYQVYWSTSISGVTNTSYLLHRELLGSTLIENGQQTCIDNSYDANGYVYATTSALPNGQVGSIHFLTDTLDVAYNPISNTDYIALTKPTVASSGQAFTQSIEILSANKNSTIQNDVIQEFASFEGKNPSIDVYPWTSDKLFAITYQNNDNVIFKRFRKPASTVIVDTNTINVPVNQDYKSTVTTYNDTLSATNEKVTEVISWAKTYPDMLGTSTINGAVFRNFENIPYLQEFAFASDGALSIGNGGTHPDRTPINSFPIVSASAPVSSSTPSNGLFVTWLSASIANPNTSSALRHLNMKKTAIDPTKLKANYKTTGTWVNKQVTEAPFQGSNCVVETSDTGWVSNLGDLFLYDRRCQGNSVRTNSFGRIEFAFPQATWSAEDQAIRSIVKLKLASYDAAEPSTKLQAKYMLDANTLNINTGITNASYFAGTYNNITTSTNLNYPIVTNANQASGYYWNYWSQFPAQYNYLGVYLEDGRSIQSNQSLESNVYLRAFNNTENGPAAAIDVDYIDWQN